MPRGRVVFAASATPLASAGIVVLAEANGVALAANTTLPRGTAIDLTLEVPVPPTTIPPPTLTPEPTTV